MIIVGDYKIHVDNYNNCLSRDFTSCLENFGLQQHNFLNNKTTSTFIPKLVFIILNSEKNHYANPAIFSSAIFHLFTAPQPLMNMFLSIMLKYITFLTHLLHPETDLSHFLTQLHGVSQSALTQSQRRPTVTSV